MCTGDKILGEVKGLAVTEEMKILRVHLNSLQYRREGVKFQENVTCMKRLCKQILLQQLASLTLEPLLTLDTFQTRNIFLNESCGYF